ncbi:hypothetical protein OEZ86_009469 [Tetradesmus obliquus]|nr:hypothetical protein OEZ86_009469 [Tetradesmus obliquus]
MSFYSLTSTYCAGLNQIKGVEGSCVRVQAGVKLADLHDYLAKQQGLQRRRPGYLSALVTEVTYVDEDGCLVVLSLAKDPSALLAFTCSYGMMGIVVEAVLEVRRRIAVTTTAYAFMTRLHDTPSRHAFMTRLHDTPS